MRAERPLSIDPAEIAEAVRKNNMGLGGIRIEARAAIRGGRAVLDPTGQSLPMAEPAPPDSPSAWRAFRVLDPEEPRRTRLEPLASPPGSWRSATP